MGPLDLERAKGLLPTTSPMWWVAKRAFGARGCDLASLFFVSGAGLAIEGRCRVESLCFRKTLGSWLQLV